MSDTTGIDVLMKVVGTSTAYDAESSTVLATGAGADKLLSGFTAGKFCELKSFSFSAGAESALSKDKDDDEKKEKDKKDKEKNRTEPGQPGNTSRGWLTYEEQRTAIGKGHKALRDARNKNDPVDMQPVEFTRIMDSMSMQLYAALAKCTTLASVTIAKRKAVGNLSASGQCYLRLVFSSVLITSLDWKESQHVMMETGTFIYRKLELHYLPQAADGSLGLAARTSWAMKSARNAGAT